MADETVVEETQDEIQEVGVRDLLDAGLHFGHQTKRWNPKMKPFIFDKRNGIHIIDLAKSLALLQQSAKFVHDVTATGDTILFVGTKKQAQKVVTDIAADANQPFVTHRWLGGMLTNSNTIRQRVKRLKELETMEKDGVLDTMHKKEASRARHELEKLRRNLSGVANMDKLPGAMFVVDINRENIAIKEANRLNIPVIAIVDTNCDPDLIDYPIPGNDDAIRAIKLISSEIAKAVKSGNDDYARKAADEARKRAEEEKKAAQARAEQAKKAEAAKQAAAEAAEAAAQAKKAEAAKAKAAKAEADKAKAAEAKAAEAKAAEAKAAEQAEQPAEPKAEAAPEASE